MPLDGVTARFLSSELNDSLSGSRIEKIYQPDRYEICLHLRTDRGHKRLLLSCNPSFPRIHMTDSVRDNPKTPPSFCMLLRKHLSGGRINRVNSPPFERIIELHITSLNELQDVTEYRLIIEMMGRYSNIILLNSDSIIIDSILHVDSRTSRVREVMPARRYEYPPNQGKLLPSEALDIVNKGNLPILQDSLGRPVEKAFLESLQGFSPQLSHEICHVASVDPRKGCRQLEPRETLRLLSSVGALLGVILKGVPSPTLYQASGNSSPIDFHALLLHDAGIPVAVDSISDAIDRLHERSFRDQSFDQIRKPLIAFVQNALAHAIRKKQTHETDILESKDCLLWKKYGDLILYNQSGLRPEATEFVALDYENTDVTHRIPLNPSLNASGNAQAYYKRYRKAKAKIDSATKFIQDDDIAIEYLMSLQQAAISATDDQDIAALRQEISELATEGRDSYEKEAGQGRSAPPGKSKTGKQRSRALRSAASRAADKSRRDRANGIKKAESSSAEVFRKFKNADDTIILCGRNNLQNDALTFRTAAPEDLWFHAKKRPGSHVVLRCFGKSPSDAFVLDAASVAAYYSSAATDFRKGSPGVSDTDPSDGAFTVEVDYCEVKRVKKIPGAKPGMVTYDQYRTLLVHPALPGSIDTSGNPA